MQARRLAYSRARTAIPFGTGATQCLECLAARLIFSKIAQKVGLDKVFKTVKVLS